MRWIWLVAVVFALALAGCGRANTVSEQQTVDGVTFTLERAASLQLLQEFTYVITLANAAGQPIEGATVFLDQQMPAMPMGSSQPIAEPLGGGRYQVRGVYTMEGDWVVQVHAVVGGQERVANFDQKVIQQ